MGRLIIIDGADGTFKSTMCKKYASETGAIYMREPGGDKLAEDIRNTIFEYGDTIDAKLQSALFTSARIILFKNKISKLLDDGKDVILDRGFPSTIVYQGSMNEVINTTKLLYGEYHSARALVLILHRRIGANGNPELKNRAVTNSYDFIYSSKVLNGRYIKLYNAMASGEIDTIGSWALLEVYTTKPNYENFKTTIGYMKNKDGGKNDEK